MILGDFSLLKGLLGISIFDFLRLLNQVQVMKSKLCYVRIYRCLQGCFYGLTKVVTRL